MWGIATNRSGNGDDETIIYNLENTLIKDEAINRQKHLMHTAKKSANVAGDFVETINS